MMSDRGSFKPQQDQLSGSGHSAGTHLRQNHVANSIASKRDSIASKRVCFYKSGDPQFNGLHMVINNRTFKTFDALLDSLSKKVPLPFGVRNITTPRGVNAIHTLDQLEDGQSYICSDMRKVKPINLALASRKPPPWYHPRTVSPRRRGAAQQQQPTGRERRRVPAARPRRRRKQNQNTLVAWTPKRLTVFQNGDPGVRHTVILQKKTMPTFRALLDYVSGLMRFPVVKLHTPNGGRVDGLPALIMCAGRVVAAGREAFKFANYNSQKPTVTRQTAPNRKKPMSRKTKSTSSGAKSRPFSPSSERYFVNQIHNSMAGSLYEYPSHRTGSVEMDAGHQLESLAETEGDAYMEEAGGELANPLPTDDDIEKSFRVNQDGSMTVEMRVRLTIKEEETVQWTTTLSRSNMVGECSMAEFLAEHKDLPLPPAEGAALDSIMDSNNSNNNNGPFLSENGTFCEEGNGYYDDKTPRDSALARRTPTPGQRTLRHRQASMESVKTVTGDKIQENMTGSYSYREKNEDGEVTEEYRMARHSTTKPVPKPRHANSPNQPTFKSNGTAEILQIEDNGGEITETVLHIYEQQSCQDSYLANSELGSMCNGRVPTQSTAQFTTGTSNGWETELGERTGPSVASESMSVRWANENTASSDFTAPVLRTGKVYGLRRTNVSGTGKENSPKDRQKAKRTSSKPKKKTRARKITPDNKKGKAVYSSAPSARRIYGFKNPGKIKKKRPGTGNGNAGNGNAETAPSALPGGRIKFNLQHPNKLSTMKEQNVSDNRTETSFPFMKNVSNDSPSVHVEDGGVLTMQSTPLPAINSSPSVINEYVENWLERARPSPTVYLEDEIHIVECSEPNPSAQKKSLVSEQILHWNGAKENTTVCNGLSTHDLEHEAGSLSRNGSVKKTKLISNKSLERTMSLRKAQAEKSVTPSSLQSDETPELDYSSEKDAAVSPKPSVKKTRLVSNQSLEKKLLERKVSSDKSELLADSAAENSPVPGSPRVEKTPPLPRTRSLKTTASPKTPTSPVTARAKKSPSPSRPSSENNPHDNLLPKRLSPYSKSVDLVSPPGSAKLTKKSLTDKNSLNNLADRQSSPAKEYIQSGSLENTPTHTPPVPCILNDECELTNKSQGDSLIVQDHSSTIAPTTPQPLKLATQPEINIVLEKLCHSIQAIRYITLNKLASCLENSSSLPDFSRQVATTFGSSSKALLAFLSVMTLKESNANLNINQLNANSVSWIEALTMMESLREMASIEDKDKLQASLTGLQKSASTQLLQSWKGFQELSEKPISRISTPNSSVHNIVFEPCSEIECYVVENNINELINELDMPEKLKAELTALPVIITKESDEKETVTETKMETSPDEKTGVSSTVVNEDAGKVYQNISDGLNVDVRSMIERLNIQQTKEVTESHVSKGVTSENLILKVEPGCHGEEQSAREDVDDRLEEAYEHTEKGYEQEDGNLKEEKDQTTSSALHGVEKPTCPEVDIEHFDELPSSNKKERKNIETERSRYMESEPNYTQEVECEYCKDRKSSVLDIVPGEEGHPDYLVSHDALGYKESQPIVLEPQSGTTEEEGTLTQKEILYTLEEHIDRDSRNNRTSCETPTCEEEEGNYEAGYVCEEQLGLELTGSSSGVDHVAMETEHYIEDSYCHESIIEEQISEEEASDELETNKDTANETSKEKAVSSVVSPVRSVAERVGLLEKKVSSEKRRNVIVETPGIKRKSEGKQKVEIPIVDDDDDLTDVSSQLSNDYNEHSQVDDIRMTHSAPQSSLAFSYDSSSSSSREREGKRVKDLKDMFMAKSAADIHRAPSPNALEPSGSRPGSPHSDRRQSKGSPEGIDDESLLTSIAKGIVRRTIETLYGKKDQDKINDSGIERPPSAPKTKLRESAIKSIFSPLHPTKVMSDLSYFNATNSFDPYSEPTTRCIAAFNAAQVAPEVSGDTGRYIYKDNAPIRKSISEPATMNKRAETCSKSDKDCEHTKEDVPYSHFSRTSPQKILSTELENEVKPEAPKCTYFTLPSDSDQYQDETSTISKASVEDDTMKEKQDKKDEAKPWNDLKKLDNKVHPVTDIPAEAQAVVVSQPKAGGANINPLLGAKPLFQPPKSQTAVNRPEPDMLDMVFVFCGQHCPIL